MSIWSNRLGRLGFAPENADELVLTNAKKINKFVHDAYGARISAGTEFFVLITMDENARVIQTNVLAEGTAGAVTVSLRDFARVYQQAFTNARGELWFYALVHNHPSGSPLPSREDVAMTKAIIEFTNRHVGQMRLIDHVIVTKKRTVYGSMASTNPELWP